MSQGPQQRDVLARKRTSRSGEFRVYPLRNGRFGLEVRLWEANGGRTVERFGDSPRDFETEDEASAHGAQIVAAWNAGKHVPVKQICPECQGATKCSFCGGSGRRNGGPCVCVDLSDKPPGLCRGCWGEGFVIV